MTSAPAALFGTVNSDLWKAHITVLTRRQPLGKGRLLRNTNFGAEWLARYGRQRGRPSSIDADRSSDRLGRMAIERHRARYGRFGFPAAGIGVLVLIIWAATGAGYFWPGWVWFGLAVPFAIRGALRWSLGVSRRRGLAVHGALSLVAALICVVVWLLAGAGYPWPLWPVLGLAVALGIHIALFPPSSASTEQLVERVGTLTESRKTVIEIQEAELRRIERDLHDGAQARLVSLGMSLGMADEILRDDPEAARRLLADARASASKALSDLRDLVSGIRPPVLADLGLQGAIDALVVTVPIPVNVTVQLPGSPPEPIESAVYFAVAEAMANVVKHSGARWSWISCDYWDGVLVATVGDDGVGGADPAKGSGLSGIQRRLSAFDATLRVDSPPGGPTVVTVEVPCELSSPKT